MPEKTQRSGVGEAWLAQRESSWHPLGNGVTQPCSFWGKTPFHAGVFL
jgi:hypothetical protein